MSRLHFCMRFLLRSIATAALLPVFASPAMAQLHWGSFKDNGCVAKSGMRVYSSVLWGIPPGQDWIGTCLRTRARFKAVNGKWLNFPRPTTCTKSSISEALGVASLVIGAPGLVYVPAGAVSLILGAGSLAMEKQGIGALNVWGIFNVMDPSCPVTDHRPAGWIQSILVTTPGYPVSRLEQGFTPKSLGGRNDLTRVCLRNFGARPRSFSHHVKGIGNLRTGNGEQSCANFPASARVTFTLGDGTHTGIPSRAMTMSLRHFAGGTVDFFWN